ncbi:MAG: GTPase Era [Planctomycetota bacterium]|nr:MAG: GTPase Era [Planctomycetota bacterium]
MSQQETTFSGFVTLLGRTNVGKSTLLNALLNQKVSIVTEKPQTTQFLVKGILTEGNRQAVFVDTPGLHRPHSKYGEMFLGDIPKALEEVDLVVVLVEPGDRVEGGTAHLLEMLQKVEAPRFLVVNKIDLSTKGEALQTAKMIGEACSFDFVLPVSALKYENVDFLREKILEALPEGPFYYPEDYVTDLPQPLYVAEVIREKVMLLTRDEVPHAVGVLVDTIQEREDGAYYIEATLYVERESQKGILIGKGGSMIKKIGTLAREELEDVTGRKIILKTRVKVMKNWQNTDKAKLFRPQ